VQLDAGQALRVTAIEIFSEPQDGGERTDRPPALAREVGVLIVLALRRGASMVPGDQRYGVDLLGLEAAEVAVLDEIVGMLVMALIADVNADVVQQRRVLEPLALAVGEGMHASSLIEHRHRQACHLSGMLWPVVAALRQFDDAAAANVGIPIDLRDLLPVPGDVVEH
jgi:hypothetical protein